MKFPGIHPIYDFHHRKSPKIRKVHEFTLAIIFWVFPSENENIDLKSENLKFHEIQPNYNWSLDLRITLVYGI